MNTATQDALLQDEHQPHHVLILVDDDPETTQIRAQRAFGNWGDDALYYFTAGKRYHKKPWLEAVKQAIPSNLLHIDENAASAKTSTKLEMQRFAELVGTGGGFAFSHIKHRNQIDAIKAKHLELAMIHGRYEDHAGWTRKHTILSMVATLLIKTGLSGLIDR